MFAPRKWPLVLGVTLTLIYTVLALRFIATTPDLRLRVMLVSNPQTGEMPRGVELVQGVDVPTFGPSPQAGDILIRVGDRRTETFFDFAASMYDLYGAPLPPDGALRAGADPSQLDDAFSLPKIVEPAGGPRMVEVEFFSQANGQLERSWLPMNSLPTSEITLSVVWLLLELAIGSVAVLAYWYRPYDESAALFCAMCLVSLGAFIGGFHWWVVAESFWLAFPFVISAMLLPVIILHFFLVYPRRQLSMATFPRTTVAALYAAPGIALGGFLVLHMFGLWLPSTEPDAIRVDRALASLEFLRHGINVYVVFASICFGLSLAALLRSFFLSRNPTEYSQLKWIVSAALFAIVPVGYSLYLAWFDRDRFAFGGARIPMFAASLAFMLAYAIGIAKYRLMLVDQIVSRGMLYYLASALLSMGFALAVAISFLLGRLPGVPLYPQQTLAIAVILVVAVLLLLWLRDLFQRLVDSRFFREKYRLDRALQRMHQAVDRLVDPQTLGEQMLGSCRDVLRVERAALYFRRVAGGPLHLVAHDGSDQDGMPAELSPAPELLEILKTEGSVQRVIPGTRGGLSPVQHTLHALRADLIYALEIDETVAALVVLGGKRAGDSFTAEDLTFLNALGQITNVALHGARIHQEISRLNDEMQGKVERIANQHRQIAMLQAELASLRTERPSSQSMLKGPFEEFRRDALKGNSPAILQVLENVRKVAATESTVLVRGASGTGKELLARVLHDNSPRRDGPLVSVHCAALSPSLLESELFGHVKGAFTGAHRDKIGRFEAANSGTLFLDEIGDISLETQIKLLRVLQERKFEPVGGSRTIEVDVRLITATHQNLERLISDGRFREDLYYRLNVIMLTLPSLHERSEDIFDLAAHFLSIATRRVNRQIERFDDAALAALESYEWPGNIRELENAIERAVVLAERDVIRLQDLPAEIARGASRRKSQSISRELKSETVASPYVEAAVLSGESERERLVSALEACAGNKAQAARMLGMARSTYHSKLQKYGIDSRVSS